MNARILLVDDEVNVLEGYRRLLRQDFSLEIALGGEKALELAQEQGPFAVIVCDMRMPGMDGIQLLSKFHEISPDTVRIMLTGNADVKTAIDAVNEGCVFRFLTKPCPKDTLAKTINAALMQYRLVNAEKDLLENTLSGSIQVLTEVLSLVNPAAFGRAMRIKRYVHHVVTKLQVRATWQFEIAALMSQLGCVTLDSETLESIYGGKALTELEQARFTSHPAIAEKLLSSIPRMEAIARMIGSQQQALADDRPISDLANQDAVVLGAMILRTTILFDEFVMRGSSYSQAVAELRRKRGFHPAILSALENMPCESLPSQIRACTVSELRSGMVLQEDVRTNNGLLIVAKGQEITYPLLVRLGNFRDRRAIEDRILVSVPSMVYASELSAALASAQG